MTSDGADFVSLGYLQGISNLQMANSLDSFYVSDVNMLRVSVYHTIIKCFMQSLV